MEAATELGAGAERIESMEWLREFGDRYQAAWSAYDPDACVTEDIVWEDPALPEPARGRAEVAEFVRTSVTAFPDLGFSEPGAPAISEDGLVAYVPWRMRGTNTGPIEPPGFAPTGRTIEVEGIDLWQFRNGLIWRYRAAYDFAGTARQLGLLPRRGGLAEKGIVGMQRLRSRLPL
jgi:hypothetical protein